MSRNSETLLGLRLSAGLALGKAWVFRAHSDSDENYLVGSAKDENLKFEVAVQSVDRELQRIEELSHSENSPQSIAQSEIIATHRMLLQDPEWCDQIRQSILENELSATEAVRKATANFAEMMLSLDDAYLRERANDIRDIGQRVMQTLHGRSDSAIMPDTGEYILVAKDLTPSQFASLDKSRVLGLITEKGGVTSHTAIMARLYEIPALSAIDNATDRIQNDDWLFVQADKSDLYINPDEALRSAFSNEVLNYKLQKVEMLRLRETPSMTRDKISIHLEANIGRESDLEIVQKYNVQGVGLFRTEFLFFDRPQAPSENEQYLTYKKVSESLSPHPVVIRTFDIGADKQVPYLHWPKEENPFLGLRALRYCLKEPKLFHTQLRALLKASHERCISIMFPMVSSVEELDDAKIQLEICKKQVEAEGYVPNYKLGIMIEVPSAALMADKLAPEVDFFSIGTNDLIQYVCAVDRMNEGVAHLYESFHPGVLNLISQVIAAAKKHEKGVAMCGEMAADLDLIPLLVGMGLRTFSQSPATVLRSKNLLQKLSVLECEDLWNQVKNCSRVLEIQKLCNEFKNRQAKLNYTHLQL